MFIVCISSAFFFFKQKTAYEMRISDWSSDVCSSDLNLCHTALFDERPIRRIGVITGAIGRALSDSCRVGSDDIAPISSAVGGPEAGRAVGNEAGLQVDRRKAIRVAEIDDAIRGNQLIALQVAEPAGVLGTIRLEDADEDLI